ncbi:PMS1 protein homolog 1-like isoform X2 [Centruroides sculpturatus]|uniref:PMS1 protein homolog 1-like isoform X2 n=1 Tax=Centruroides sculpturatus TaxID=218467 RepID=UPI000C6CFC84|nr:PMS1 protein homolog 1-like isoform X2 [Centruroides sculpturatus]
MLLIRKWTTLPLEKKKEYKLKAEQINKQLDEDLDNSKFNLIGQISNSGMWIVSYEDHILAVNHFRVQETVEYYRLLATHYFILSELDCPIMLSQSSFGELEIWNALFKLNSEKNEEIGYSLITDDKIIANGFEIKIYTDTAEIVRITKSLPFYGISDLKEILQIIHKQGSSIKLENCRPQKVIHYLQLNEVADLEKLRRVILDGLTVHFAFPLLRQTKSLMPKEYVENKEKFIPAGKKIQNNNMK